MKRLYRHPDHGEVVYEDGALTVCSGAENAISLPIGALGMAEMAQVLLECAAVAKRAEDWVGTGEVLARELIGELHQLAEHPACESARALAEMLHALAVMDDPAAAAKGFARVIAPLLMDAVWHQSQEGGAA